MYSSVKITVFVAGAAFRDFSLTLRARCSIFVFAAGLFGVLFCLTLEVPILRKSGTKCIFER